MGLSQANVARLMSLSNKLDKLYAEAVVQSDQFLKAANDGEIPDERDLADGAYLCKQMAEKVDDMRKELEKARASASRVACEQWTIKTLSGVVKGPIHAQRCTATPKITMIPRIPKRGSEEYISMCRDLGLSDDFIAGDMFHPHWPSLVNMCTLRMRNGAPLPKGIDNALIATDSGLVFMDEKEFDLGFRKAKEL